MGFSLLLVFLLMISNTSSGGAEDQTTSSASLTDLPDASPSCPNSCGNVSVVYPFGIGDDHRCFRRGFKLACTASYDHSSPPKLFLGDGALIQVLEINMEKGFVYIKPPNVTLGVHNESLDAPFLDLDGQPFSFKLGIQYESYYQNLVDNIWYVVGCSATAMLVDFKTNRRIDTCFTRCSSTSSSSRDSQPLASSYCVLDPGVLDPDVRSEKKFNSLRIQLDRLDHEFNTSGGPVRAIMFDRISGNFSPSTEGELLQKLLKNETATLAWFIDDYESCELAMNHTTTYACRSEHSVCLNAIPNLDTNVTFGYMCRCDSNYRGNPYRLHGCQVSTFTPAPRDDCTAKCGDVDVPYPFGLEEGCYRDQSFFLECEPPISNLTAASKVLIFQNFYVVSNILLEEGTLELKITDNFPFYYYAGNDEKLIYPSTLHDQQIMYNWTVAYEACEVAEKNKTTYACVDEVSSCFDVSITSNGQQIQGYRCKCSQGYEGNPYVLRGCKDIDECRHKDKYVCHGTCTNAKGSYDCTCPPGLYGDAKIGACYPVKKHPLFPGIIVGVSSGMGFLLLCASFIILRKKYKKRQQRMMRKRYFHRNHGLLLKQLISTGEDMVERTKIFSFEEMKKATDNFDRTRVLGRGGHGTVYKGILSDQRVVAIKKSKITKQAEINQFINEVVILSQINHRHVVKLFGCCLETEVPLLVYEFVSNGTLSDHLHVPSGNSTLSWGDRLRIAAEAAEALAYLHSAASISIFHRDVKSSNILLDDHLSAKVSDFGASRFIPEDQTHLVTVVQGTFGYLDPEYYQTGQLTEKSDVYSFGIILLELLTGRKPIYSTDDEGKSSLSMHFFQALRNNQLFDLMDDQVAVDGAEEEIWEFIRLIEKCLSLRGANRPTMKEVELSLQRLERRIERTKRQQQPCFAAGEEEAGSLLSSDASVLFSESVDQVGQSTSRNYYSSEKELTLLNDFPR